jgi:hypothetical protein
MSIRPFGKFGECLSQGAALVEVDADSKFAAGLPVSFATSFNGRGDRRRIGRTSVNGIELENAAVAKVRDRVAQGSGEGDGIGLNVQAAAGQFGPCKFFGHFGHRVV